MDILARLLHRTTFYRLAYEPIREDFLSWYQKAYYDLSLDEKMEVENSELVEMAVNARTEALTYEPDNTLSSAISVASDAEAIIGFTTALISILSIFVGSALFGIGFSHILPTIFSVPAIIGGGIFIIPSIAYPSYKLIKYSVETNEELIRLYNEDLVVSVKRITENGRRPDLLTSYYIHHSSLCSTTKIPVIVVLGVIRTISPYMYGIICSQLQDDISKYQGQNFWQLMGKEYARLRNSATYKWQE